jgi:hypothetical protein
MMALRVFSSPVPVGNLRSEILMVQSAQNRHRLRATDRLNSTWDITHDIADLAGYNVPGTTRYLDRDFFHALTDPAYAPHLGIGPIDTGLSPADTVECLMRHEGVEKVILDADNPIDTYLPAHEHSTIAEHELVRQKGGTPLKYERGLKKARKTLRKPPGGCDLAHHHAGAHLAGGNDQLSRFGFK